MSLYDPNGTKQKPIVRNGTRFFSHAVCPVSESYQKRPSYVNVNSVGTYAFCYDSGSVASLKVHSNYITGSKVNHANAGGIKLDISPVSWRRTDSAGVVGDVTFVYVRVN